jgi:hypothetical protein
MLQFKMRGNAQVITSGVAGYVWYPSRLAWSDGSPRLDEVRRSDGVARGYGARDWNNSRPNYYELTFFSPEDQFDSLQLELRGAGLKIRTTRFS